VLPTRGLLIALVVVAAIVAVLVFVKSGPKAPYQDQVEVYSKAQAEVTRSNMQNLEKAIFSYISDEGHTPESLQDLRNSGALSGGVLDGWGSAIKYEKLTDSTFRLTSAGKDKSLGTSDDIVVEDS